MSDPGAPMCDAGAVRHRPSGARHLLRHAADGARARRTRRAGVAARVRPRGGHDRDGRRRRGPADPALFAGIPDEIRVWASHGDFVAARAGRLCRRRRPARTRRSRRWPIRARALYALLFHPEVVHTERGLEILRNFAYGVCGCTGDWTMASFVEEATARIRAQVGSGRVVCALSGGVDSTVAALIIHRADRRPADVHLRRQRRAAAGRGGADPQALRAAAAAAGVRRRVAAVPRAARGRHRSGAEAQDHRRHLHRRVRGGGGEARPGRFPRAGHAVSRRDRVGGDRRAVVDDQEPPQRRRAARADADEAGRAAARAVQGRSARGRAQARARRGVRRAAAVSRAGPRGADPRRGHAAAARRCCAAPTRSSSRK